MKGRPMRSTADVRKSNLHKVRSLLWEGGAHTKQQIAESTGLSVATCNTLLNEMEGRGEVLGERVRLHGVGRGSTQYRIDERFESTLCVTFDLVGEKRVLTLTVLSPLGCVEDRWTITGDLLDFAALTSAISSALERQGNVTQIMVGTPSIAEYGIIRHCDIPELEGQRLVEQLECRFLLPVCLQNDMHFKAYGYYCQTGNDAEVVTLVNAPAGVLPGTATVHGGTVIRGANQFAGMVGFLPFGCSQRELIELLGAPGTALPILCRATAALVVALNPHAVVFTGSLLGERDLGVIRQACLESIPEEYLPPLHYERSFDGYYLHGMYRTSLDLKGLS